MGGSRRESVRKSFSSAIRGDENDPDFSKYQLVAKKLLQASRSGDKTGVLPPMKEILLTCKQISQDCESREHDKSIPTQDREALSEIKAKLSEGLNSLMKATKNHASEGSSRSADKIAEEVKSLSFCLSDLLETMKIINSNGGNKNDTLRSKRDTLRSTYNDDDLPPLSVPELKVG
jgi:hypothetical protein